MDSHECGWFQWQRSSCVATGQSPFGFGTDIGGSIRITCAWCGTWFEAQRWILVDEGVCGSHAGQEVIRAQLDPWREQWPI